MNRLKKFIKRSGIILGIAIVAFLLLWNIFPFPKEKLKIASSTVVCDRFGEPLRAFTNEEGNWLIPFELKDMSPYLIYATIAIEDKRFFSHIGVDPIAVIRATGTNIVSGHRVSGASTITMQVIRLLEKRPRTLISKLIESFRAVQLETILSKNNILHYYLNLAPYGGNIYGVEAASLRYFGKHCKYLTPAEAALIAGLPQAPSRLRPDKFPEKAKKRRNQILSNMYKCEFITKEQLGTALNEPVDIKPHDFPFKAPHFTQMVKKYAKVNKQLITTLDSRTQQIAEKAVAEIIDSLKDKGVTNGAIVVIENETSSVRAMVGSRSFFDSKYGQVNGAISPRSPGSALKPFTYALAFDKGVCIPSEILSDVPRRYRDYEPENYEHNFSGIVSAREALSRSLNIPAIYLLNKVGVDELRNMMQEAGISTLTKSAQHYGLALTLGACEVSLLELTNAYSALARLGIYKPYRLLETDYLSKGERILSSASTYLIADILSDYSRLSSLPNSEFAMPDVYTINTSLPRIAWKTGTSYGHHDAWAIGYNSEYTIGIWLGNFSGKPSRELVGISAPLPLVLKVFKELYNGKSGTWYDVPEDVDRVSICSVSGMPAGEFCPTKNSGLAIKNIHLLNDTCNVHKEILIDDATGYRLCSLCASGRKYHKEYLEMWQPHISSYLVNHGIQTYDIPAHLPTCNAANKSGVQIVSPANGQNYELYKGENQKYQKIALDAVTSAGSSPIYWFIDHNFYKKANIDEKAYWTIEKGKHTIACIDDNGNTSSVNISVK